VVSGSSNSSGWGPGVAASSSSGWSPPPGSGGTTSQRWSSSSGSAEIHQAFLLKFFLRAFMWKSDFQRLRLENFSFV
jgi:hypothetical protein